MICLDIICLEKWSNLHKCRILCVVSMKKMLVNYTIWECGRKHESQILKRLVVIIVSHRHVYLLKEHHKIFIKKILHMNWWINIIAEDNESEFQSVILAVMWVIWNQMRIVCDVLHTPQFKKQSRFDSLEPIQNMIDAAKLAWYLWYVWIIYYCNSVVW